MNYIKDAIIPDIEIEVTVPEVLEMAKISLLQLAKDTRKKGFSTLEVYADENWIITKAKYTWNINEQASQANWHTILKTGTESDTTDETQDQIYWNICKGINAITRNQNLKRFGHQETIAQFSHSMLALAQYSKAQYGEQKYKEAVCKVNSIVTKLYEEMKKHKKHLNGNKKTVCAEA